MNRFFAHRGIISKDFPENSLSAFKEAISMKKGIELDVRITKDGVPVVIHDPSMKRLCKDKRRISACTYQEISSLHLLDTDEKIPTLEEVLELVQGKVPVLIELKLPKHFLLNHRLERAVLPLLKKYKGEYLLQAYNKHAVRYMKQKLPKIKCGILSAHHKPEPKDFDFICYRYRGLSTAKMLALKNSYNEVFIWTEKQLSESKLKKLDAEFYPDGVIN